MPYAEHKSINQEAAEASVADFQRELGPFVVAAETTRMAMAFTDATVIGDPIIFANEAFLFLTGYTGEEVLAKSLGFFAKPGASDKTLIEIAAACHEHEGGPDIQYLRKDGRSFWASTFVSPVYDEAGSLVQHFVSLADNTEHHEERARCHALIDELNHRVKNTLSTIQGVVAQAINKEPNKVRLRDAIETRIFALSRLHDMLSHVGWVKTGLRDVVESSLNSVLSDERITDRVVVRGPNLCCSPKATIALGMALHELAMNAREHGALSTDSGSVTVTWSVVATSVPKLLRISWVEAHGPTVSSPQVRGYGSKILERGLAHELGGAVSLAYNPAGLECLISLPSTDEFE